MRPLSFWLIPHLANFQPDLFLFNLILRFNPHTFLEVSFDRNLSVLKDVILPKAKFFSHLKALRCIFAFFLEPYQLTLWSCSYSFLFSSIQAFLLKLAPFYILSSGLGGTYKSTTSLLRSSDSRSVLATPSSPPFFL